MNRTSPSRERPARSDGAPRVVIVGAGFAGLSCARALADVPVDVTLVDEHNYHTFQPLLYQVATAELPAEDVSSSARAVLRRQQRAAFRQGRMVGLDDGGVELADGTRLPFDYLVIAVGAVTADFGIPGVREFGLPLKTLPQAVRLRNHILDQFERAAADPAVPDDAALTFVVAGGGPTGVELAGALVELFHGVLAKDLRGQLVDRARVMLVELAPSVLTSFHPALQAYTRRQLERRGVELVLGAGIARASADEVELTDGRRLATRTLVWTAGIRAHPLADGLGMPQTRGGRIVVDADLRVPGRDNVFVLGDLAAAPDPADGVYPQLAPVARQEGAHAAAQIARLLDGGPTTPFRYRDRGVMATIGRSAAVADLFNRIRLTGHLAWVTWLLLHLAYLIGFRNRLSVLVNWGWNYLTWDRAGRIVLDTCEREG